MSATKSELVGPTPSETLPNEPTEPTPRDRRAAIANLKEVLDHIQRARHLMGEAYENPAVIAEHRADDVDDYLELAAYDVRLYLGVLEH